MGVAKRIWLVLFVSLLGGTATAEILQNDGFQTGDEVGFQGGFVVGEEGAAELVTSNDGSWKLQRVLYLFGGATTQQTITLHIYQASADATPGTELFSGDYQVTGSNENISEIDLSGENVIVSGAFRVSIELQHEGLPSIARDNDGTITANLNFLKAAGLGWVKSGDVGLTGDWIIRAEVTQQGGVPDAGVNMPDAGATDASPDPDAGAAQTCSLHSDCERGAHCNDQSICTVQCRTDIDCSSGSSCNTELGRCDASSSDSGCGCSSQNAPIGSLAGFLLILSIAALRRRWC